MGAAQDTQGDDWLTVNVWTPEPDPGAGRAVMVWIHGGYMLGTSGLPEYQFEIKLQGIGFGFLIPIFLSPPASSSI